MRAQSNRPTAQPRPPTNKHTRHGGKFNSGYVGSPVRKGRGGKGSEGKGREWRQPHRPGEERAGLGDDARNRASKRQERNALQVYSVSIFALEGSWPP